MTGRQERMTSPSSSTMRRSTPCVDGCWGPRLSDMSGPVTWTSFLARPVLGVVAAEASISSVLTSVGLLGAVSRVAAENGLVVLAERVALPIFRKQNPHPRGVVHVRVAGESDSEEVERFALVPVHAGPDGNYGAKSGVLARKLDPDGCQNPLVHRIDAIPGNEMLAGIHGAEVRWVIEAHLVAKEKAEVVRRGGYGIYTEIGWILTYGDDGIGKAAADEIGAGTCGGRILHH